MHSIVPVELAYVPSGHALQVALPLLPANEPMGHASGFELPIPLKKPCGVMVHCALVAKPVREAKVPGGHGRGIEAPVAQ